MFKQIKQYAIALLIIIVASQGIAYYNVMSTTEEETNGNFMRVSIEHRNADGELLNTICIDDDLLLRNMAYWLAIQNSGSDYLPTVLGATAYKLKTTSGALIGVSTPYYEFDVDPANAKMYIGEGTTAPVITDYVIETPAMSEFVIDREYWSSGTQFNITIDCLFLIDATYAITEVALGTRWEFNDIIIARDTFPAINVNIGDTFVVRYYLLFNWS